MGHPVIPAPTRFDAGDGPGFAFRPGTVIAYADAGIAPLVGRFFGLEKPPNSFAKIDR